jgi:hypothetical protein
MAAKQGERAEVRNREPAGTSAFWARVLRAEGTSAIFSAPPLPMVKKKVDCQDCRYFKRAPYEASRTGCWFPDFMQAKQKDAFLQEQEVPGDHEKINLRGDCTKFEARQPKRSFWKRMLAGEF